MLMSVIGDRKHTLISSLLIHILLNCLNYMSVIYNLKLNQKTNGSGIYS